MALRPRLATGLPFSTVGVRDDANDSPETSRLPEMEPEGNSAGSGPVPLAAESSG